MTRPFPESDNQPRWDVAQAERLHGATVLVGLTFEEPEGPQLEQFFGTVMSTDPHEGITLRLEGSRSGELYTLPPDLRAFFPAPPGSYRLRQTGEVVEDPDYTTTWERTPPGKPTFRIGLGRRFHLSGWPAMLLAPVFIPIILLLRGFPKACSA